MKMWMWRRTGCAGVRAAFERRKRRRSREGELMGCGSRWMMLSDALWVEVEVGGF